MEKELFWFATIVESLLPKRNKHYKRDFASTLNGEHGRSNVMAILNSNFGPNTLVSNISVTEDVTMGANYYHVSFSYAYSDSQLTTPWDVAQDGAITFLLCAKHFGLYNDVALLIAKRVYTSVSLEVKYAFTRSDGVLVTWIGTCWMTRGGCRIKCCVNCKYPCEKALCKVCKKLK